MSSFLKKARSSKNKNKENADPPGTENEPTIEELMEKAASKGDSEPVDEELKKVFHPFQDQVDDVVVDGNEDKASMETDRKGLMKRLKDFVGGDLTKIAIPVFFNEPTSFLHRAAETAEHWHLLKEAASKDKDDPVRMAFISAFAIAAYSSAERTTKPFNPLLGETFEWITDETRFVAEQVSHHPPVCVAHMESDLFTWWQHKSVKANFTGNAVTSPPLGTTWLQFKGEEGKYDWDGLTSCVHNLIVGRLWIDHYGTFSIQSDHSKVKADLNFTQCGWFSRGWHKVLSTIYDAKGNVVLYVGGLWHEQLEMWDAKHGKAIEKVPDEEKTLLWKRDPVPEKASWRNFTTFMDNLCKLTPQLRQSLPRSDSRFRPDILELQKSNYRLAGREKYKLEEKQRSERKRREAGELPPWKIRYFDDDGNGGWTFNGKYWKEREERLKEKGIELFGPSL